MLKLQAIESENRTAISHVAIRRVFINLTCRFNAPDCRLSHRLCRSGIVCDLRKRSHRLQNPCADSIAGYN